MKRQTWIVIGLVAFVAAILSIVLSNALFGTPQKYSVKVPVVEEISPSFPSPDTESAYKKFFNNKALDPTQLIEIGGGNNQTPFQGNEGQ